MTLDRQVSVVAFLAILSRIVAESRDGCVAGQMDKE